MPGHLQNPFSVYDLNPLQSEQLSNIKMLEVMFHGTQKETFYCNAQGWGNVDSSLNEDGGIPHVEIQKTNGNIRNLYRSK